MRVARPSSSLLLRPLRHQRWYVAFLLLCTCATTQAQNEHVKLASPGDSVATPGPLATTLSSRMNRTDVAKALTLVGDWQLGRLPAEAQYDWTWATLYVGFMAVPDEVAGSRYRSAMRRVAEALQFAPGPRVEHADDQAVGQLYLDLYSQSHEQALIQPMRARLDQELATPDTPGKPLWWWCDALFMAPPVFARMSAVTGDTRYSDFMSREWQITSDQLYDQKKHLYSRDASFLDQHQQNGEKIFWSRGNGWVMAGIVHVLQALPKNSPLRPAYEKRLREMAQELISLQGSDGLWRPGLLDPGSYPLPEVSGSAFIAYALAYGVNENLLDPRTYRPAVEKSWAGMLTHVYQDGRLGCIQPVGAAPGAFTESSSYVYGIGAYLLAGSEIYRGISINDHRSHLVVVSRGQTGARQH